MKAASAGLIVLGVLIILWGAFGFKTQEKVLDVGPIHATKEVEHNVPYGTIAGAILVVAGVGLFLKGRG